MNDFLNIFIVFIGIGLAGVLVLFFIYHVQAKRTVKALLKKIAELENEINNTRQDS